MNRCPNCKTEILFENAEFCEHCGVSLLSNKAQGESPEGTDEGLDFEVSEAHADHSDDTGKSRGRKPSTDELGVQSSAELVERLSLDDEPGRNMETKVTGSTPDSAAMATGRLAVSNPPKPAPGGPTDGSSLHHLSEDEVKKIEKRLYSGSGASYLSEEEKRDLLKNMKPGPKASSTPPPLEPDPKVRPEGPNDLPRPQIAKRSRGVAYFVSNWVQVQGGLELHESDEIQINDRAYLLKKKKLSPKALSIVAGSIFVVILFIVGSLFVSNHSDGKGQLVGIALDQHMQPNLQGATVQIADLGLSLTTNPQGFFHTDRIPAGSHKIDYLVNGQIVGSDYATVTAGQTTMMSLHPTDEMAVTSPDLEPIQSISQQQQAQSSVSSGRPAQPEIDRPTPARTAQSDPYGRIALKANIDGAKFALNGGVLGAGNMTYSRIKAGTHNYTVSADGYQPVSGTIEVAGGETQLLQINLVPKTTSAPTKKPEDDYAAAVMLLHNGQPSEAINALNSLLEKQPSNAAAVASRADAYLAIMNKNAALDDYIKAAEIYRAKNDGNNSMTAYNNALRIDPNSIAALLGRASLRLEHGDEIAAITDYESVVKVDKKNAQAYYGLGEARYDQGNYKEAIKHWKDARSLDPNNPEVYQNLMLAYMGDDDLKNVKKSFEKFKELASQDQMARLQADHRFDAVLRIVASDE